VTAIDLSSNEVTEFLEFLTFLSKKITYIFT